LNTTLQSLREQGIQALREGNLDQAIDRLSRTLIADTQDAEAQMFLGIAYSQKGLHAPAKRALQTAVELRPQEARWHFNLGVALELAGDTAGAEDAYRQAARLAPEQTQVRARLQGPNASIDAPRGAVSSTMASAAGTSTWSAPCSAGGLAMEAPSPARPAGAIECSRCRQWSKPGLSCEWCSALLRGTSVPGSAPWLQGTYLSVSRQSATGGSGYSTAPEMSAGEAFGRRLAAELIDGVIFTIVDQLAIWGILGHPAGLNGGPIAPGEILSSLLPSLGIGYTLYFGYYCGMLGLCGQTLGKMALRLRVVSPDGGNPTLWSAFLREFVGKFVSGIPFCLGYLWMLWDGEQQTWHDKIAGTHVERA
jgi:uncharacterized RDD family membrane protein YckC